MKVSPPSPAHFSYQEEDDGLITGDEVAAEWGLAAGCRSKNQHSRETDVGRKERCFNQNASNLGRWCTQCPPKNHLRRFCSAMKVFKGKGEIIWVNHWDRESDSSPSPPVCRLVNYLWSFFRWYIVHTICEITEGEAEEEIWSSVNYLFFISTSLIYRKN